MESHAQPLEQNADHRKNIISRILNVTISILLMGIILFGSAGTIHWLHAWLLIGTSVLILLVNLLIFPPELISERGRKKENVEKWDKIIIGFMMIPWLAIYLIAGLDYRFEWTITYPNWIHLIGLLFFILGNAIISWAMVSNTYFSTAVRIQYDRDHKVIMSGPYQYVRHPGYVGMIIYHCFTPIALGTLWALIPAFLTSFLFIIRTSMEDKTLEKKLEGYLAYTKKVKYRLFPGIW